VPSDLAEIVPTMITNHTSPHDYQLASTLGNASCLEIQMVQCLEIMSQGTSLGYNYQETGDINTHLSLFSIRSNTWASYLWRSLALPVLY